MTATLTIVLIGLAVLLALFMAMPGAVLIAKRLDEKRPGLFQNLLYWALVSLFTLLALVGAHWVTSL